MVASLAPFALPPLVAASQNLGLMGLLIVVSVTVFLEVTDR